MVDSAAFSAQILRPQVLPGGTTPSARASAVGVLLEELATAWCRYQHTMDCKRKAAQLSCAADLAGSRGRCVSAFAGPCLCCWPMILLLSPTSGGLGQSVMAGAHWVLEMHRQACLATVLCSANPFHLHRLSTLWVWHDWYRPLFSSSTSPILKQPLMSISILTISMLLLQVSFFPIISSSCRSLAKQHFMAVRRLEETGAAAPLRRAAAAYRDAYVAAHDAQVSMLQSYQTWNATECSNEVPNSLHNSQSTLRLEEY